MYDLLYDISQRPAPFSRYTAKELWTRPHLARQMLGLHLNQETDLASRRFEAIDNVVKWIDAQVGLSEKLVCDLGCGPGLYTQRFAARGAEVTGVDFSAHSLEYAKTQAKRSIHYIEADYLSDDLPTGFDVVTLIYTDLCVLSPEQRNTLLGRIHEMLNPGGQIVIDVAGTGSLVDKQELTTIENRLMDGFWAAGDYVGIQRTFIYPEKCLSLDRYLIVEPGETWQIYNWFQHFTPETIEAELKGVGFEVDEMVGGLSWEPLKPESKIIGIVASVV
ncbi:MAG: class I SAM-dependent methyltransferase [Gammaproteobacteria bacterium]|nr:MAG: class I SAM-dependent methyltransferase [Gammaproteobacteria bacterium]